MKREKSYEEIVAENLQYYMRINGYSTHSLGKEIGVSATSVSNWARGLNLPRPDKIEMICLVLGITRDDLTHERDNEQNIPVPAYYTVPMLDSVYIEDDEITNDSFDGYFLIDRRVRADYCLRVDGDSMKDAQIFHGDIAFLKRTTELYEGNIYAVIFDNRKTAVLRKVYKQNDGLLLVAYNKNGEATKTNDYYIIGELVGVYHNV